MSSRFILACLVLGLLSLVGCSSKITAIEELKQQPAYGKMVYVEGVVRDRAPLIKSGAYQLQDETGTIWVITKQSLPDLGQAVTIQATIKSKSIVIQKQQSQKVYLQQVQRLP